MSGEVRFVGSARGVWPDRVLCKFIGHRWRVQAVRRARTEPVPPEWIDAMLDSPHVPDLGDGYIGLEPSAWLCAMCSAYREGTVRPARWKPAP